MSKQILPAVALLASGLSLAAHADTAPSTTIGGEAFFDLTHISQQQNGVDVAPTGTGFDVKRFYLVVDHTFDDVWSADLTTDAQYISTATNTGLSNSTTASSGGVTEVFIKRLYLQGKLDDAFVVHIGSYTSPWVPFVESLYGYRWVEKTALDRLGLGNTADWGVNATGKFGDTGVTYSASVVDGAGYKNPTRTKDVDFEGRIAWVPVMGLTVGAGFYSGHLGQVTQANDSFKSNTATRWDVVVGYTSGGFRVGAEYFNAKNYKTVNNVTAGVFGTSAVVAASATAAVPSDEADGESVWASYNFTDKVAVFARYDDAKLSKDVLSRLKDTYFNFGVAFKPSKRVDLALVYKNEKVENGATSIGSGDANTSYTIGGINSSTDGKFDEIGVYGHFNF